MRAIPHFHLETRRSASTMRRILRKGKVLGRGQRGTITYQCQDSATGEVVARKSISKKALRDGVQDEEDVVREIAILKHLPRHPNLVAYKGSYEDDHSIHIVMELCDGGELFDHIVAKERYTEQRAAAMTGSVTEVVQTCHKHGVMHRDLKPAKLLIGDKTVNASLKAIDFGLSVFFTPGERFSEVAGTTEDMAPEMLKRNYGPEVVVWSSGVILYMMLSGMRPFLGETDREIEQEILSGRVDLQRGPWARVSDSAKSLVRHMMEPNLEARYTPQQVLDHPWMQINARKIMYMHPSTKPSQASRTVDNVHTSHQHCNGDMHALISSNVNLDYNS